MNKKQIAIIGLGPRGLNALENLIYYLKKNDLDNIQIILFEETHFPGSGSVYDTEQSASNWINLNERSLELNERKQKTISDVVIPAFPSYHDWANLNYSKIGSGEIDTYPARSKIGKYLNKRFTTLIDSMEEGRHYRMINERVEKIDFKEGVAKVITDNNNSYISDDVLLTIGHQPTYEDDQIIKWKQVVEKNNELNLFTYPYPISQFKNIVKSPEYKSLAIRGFGLATIDIIRGISENLGQFNIENEETRKVNYKSDYNLKDLFIPFSLDGLPMSPKPINKSIDDIFRPIDNDLEEFRTKIENSKTQKEAEDASFIIDAIVPIIDSICNKIINKNGEEATNEISIFQAIRQWLCDYKFEHPLILSKEKSTESMMQAFINMSTGHSSPSLDYSIGQVWRHCQPSMYKALSFNKCSGRVIAKVIKLDERLKRYSYGPPVESLQQMLALVEANILNLDFVNNPNISVSDKGWELSSSNRSIILTNMVDSVLDPPDLTNVKSSLIQSLLDNSELKLVQDDLGVMTDKHGYLISESKEIDMPIALIGRLAKGTIVGTDAILECFGEGPQLWAEKVVEKLKIE